MGATILLLEDEPDVMRIMSQTLTTAGYRVVPAYGGEDAIRKARKQPPDLLLTDLAIPRMSGVEVIKTLRSDPQTKNIKIVAVTAHVWDQIAQSAGEVGVDGFIAKPFSPKQLVSEVQKYLPNSA